MEWKEYQIQDVCRLINGRAYSNDEMLEHGKYKIVRVGNLSGGNSTWFYSDLELPADKYCHNGDLLFAWACTFGPHIWKEDNTIFHYHIWKIVEDKDVVDRRFFYYYLKFATGGFLGALNGSVMVHITKSSMEKMIIRIPKKLDDQRRIASILSSLDRKIELNNKINADLEEMAQAIFKNWLSECSDDVTIGELSLNITNYEKTDAEEVVLINSSDVTEGYFDHHNYSPNKNLKGHFKKRFQRGDILYSQVRPRNRHWAYCNFDANDYLASTQLMVIRNNPSLITSILLYQYIISDNVWKEFTLKTETRSGTFPQGNYEDLSQIRVPYNSDVEGISNQLETLYAKMFMLKKENSRLSLLRDTLLPRLMSGEIEVPE